MARIVLPIPLEDRFPLDLPTNEDPDQAAYVGVRQATNEEEAAVSRLASNTSRNYNPDGSQSVKFNYSQYDMQVLQAYSVMTDCNLMLPDTDRFPDDPDKAEENAKPLFTFRRIDGKMRVDMSGADFEKAWGKLPSHWAQAIMEKIYKINKKWSPNYTGE